MADDFGFQPIAQQAPPPQSNDFGFQPIPKIPDTSGVQKMAQDNLAANENKEAGEEAKPPLTHMERLKIATGMPVDAIINGTAKSEDVNAANRSQYIKSLDNGSASNSSDWMQTYFHSVGNAIAGGGTRAVGTLAYPFLSEHHQQKLIESGALGEVPTLTGGAAHDIAAESLTRANALLSPGVGAAYTTIAAPLAPIISPAIEAAPKVAEKAGVSPENASLIPSAAEFGLNLLGLGGVHYSKPIIEAAATKLGKEPAAVTPSDVDHVIAQGSKELLPAGNDFKDVSTVTGIPETQIKNVYQETGVKPDDMFTDIQQNPSIATDIAAGKIPEQYEHLVEEKPVLPPKEAESLAVARDETTRSFSVVDKEGDQVFGGFDSAEEAKHFIEDEKFKAEERAAIEQEGKPATGELDVAGKQGEQLAAANQGRLKPKVSQKEPSEGLFDVAGRGQGDLLAVPPAEGLASELKPTSISEAKTVAPELRAPENKIVPPSETGKVTSLRSFLANNGAKYNEANELVSIKKNGKVVKGASALEYAHEIAKENGYFPKDEANKLSRPVTELQNALSENGGREHTRIQDADRVAKAKEAVETKKNLDPAKIEHEAHSAGIDTTPVKGESEKQRISRITKQLVEFYKSEAGSGAPDAIRQMIGDTIIAAEKFTGKLTGGFFEKLGKAYIRTFQPELVGPLAKRADAYLAKFKAAGQEAENAFYRQSAISKKAFDKLTHDERMEWLYDHETGRWNEEENPEHARFQSMYDAMHKAEQESIGAETAYKENYLPHQWEKPDEVRAYFNSEAAIKKFGADWFKKASEFKLIQEGIRAGFKLKTDNPESMLVARQLASDNMLRTMNLLKDMEGSGIAKKATVFGIDKKIAKTESAIAELQEKYKKEFEKKNDPRQATIEGVPPAESKTMQVVQKRLDDLQKRLDDFKREKESNKLTPAQMAELKTGFRVIGPDSHVWNLHQQVGPLWKNAMEMKGLWENQGVTGDAYRSYMQGKAIWTQVKLGLSLFHPVHVAMINLASHIASAAEHLIQGGKFSDLAFKDTGVTMGITKETFKGQDHPAVQAWNTAPEERTPQQQQIVSKMIEGGFKPTMSARDTIHFRENFDKAIAGVGLNNLRLIGTALSLPGTIMKPFFEHWIPGMKSEIYLRRYDEALARDPSLANDAGRRGEVARQIAKDTDRTYGEMNNDVQFWNKNVRDSFNAAFISGGWKLAQIYNAKGLSQPLSMAYRFAKTGEFSKADITHNMLQAYAYTGLTLALGGAINTMLGNPIGTAKDTVWDMVKNLVAPQTGEKNPDGTPIRLNQPAFAKEAYNIAHEINTKGLMAGSGAFLYHQTLIPGIVDTLTNRDFIGREEISDPTDLHQWMNAGWDAINPISVSNYEKAETKQSHVGKVAGVLGFPIAGAYLNQTPFEQKVIAKYDEQNPPKGDAYSAKLKTELKSAIASGKGVEEVKRKMKVEGMTDTQISNAAKVYTKPFTEFAWSKLPTEDQKRLIESASEEEKTKYKVKTH